MISFVLAARSHVEFSIGRKKLKGKKIYSKNGQIDDWNEINVEWLLVAAMMRLGHYFNVSLSELM